MLAFAITALLALGTAHPTHHENDATDISSIEYMREAQASLAACSGAAHIEEMEKAAHKRRSEWLHHIREVRGLYNREATADATTSHLSNLTGITESTDYSTFFKDATSCILEPKVTEGPYYVSGEVVRNDLRESQKGIDVYLDIQFVDINTCKPATGFYVDFWHTNSTGVYSGVVASGNGNVKDTSNKYANFMRGVYPVNSDGVVQFITKYPGHYTGRTNHIHILTSKSGTLYSNGTFLVSAATHIGQLFFDEDLTQKVQTVSPYSSNTQTRTTNSQDSIYKSAATGFDPIPEYVFLGSGVADGIFSWIRIGVDTTKSYSFKAAGRYSGQNA